MLSNEKIKWMTRAALYEKKEEKRNLPTTADSASRIADLRWAEQLTCCYSGFSGKAQIATTNQAA